jgi:hypothetical protein
MNKKVYGAPSCSHLGDIWLITSGAIILSRATGDPVYLSRHSFDGETYQTDFKHDFTSMFEMCLANLDSRGALVEIVDEQQNQHHANSRYFIIPHSAFYCRNSPAPVHHSFNRDNKKIITLQLQSRNYNTTTNTYESPVENWLNSNRLLPDSLIIDIYTKLLCLRDYKVQIVGKHYGMQECIQLMCNSSLFIGMCSGMSHIASSVGIPTAVYCPTFTINDWTVNMSAWHYNKGIISFTTLEDILNALNTHNIS